MKVLNDFQCNACGTLYVDKLVENTELTIDCLNCPNSATKVRTVPNFSLPGNGQGFPTADDRWVAKREQKMAEETRRDA